MATIKDIAKHAGVSTATVSRVLNENARVAEPLKKAVYRAMRELNYYPNLIARSLKKEKTLTIGIIVLNISNAHLSSICYAVETILTEKDYLPLVCSTNNDPELERKYLHLMMSRKVDGIVIHSCGENSALIAQISQTIPTVAVLRRIEHPDYCGDFVDADSVTGTYMITKHLLEQGHRKIFIINGPLNVSAGYDRFFGFQRAMQEYNITVDAAYPYRCDTHFKKHESMQAVEQLLQMPDRATAVVTTNAETLLGVLSYCRIHDVRIPEDLSVVSYIKAVNDDLFYITCTCALGDYFSVGQRAGALILERIDNPQLPNREVIYPSAMLYGNSVKPL